MTDQIIYNELASIQEQLFLIKGFVGLLIIWLLWSMRLHWLAVKADESQVDSSIRNVLIITKLEKRVDQLENTINNSPDKDDKS